MHPGTGQLKLGPFTAREAALFHPAYSPEDRVRAYSVCGGLLHEEAELMLRQSIADPTNHSAVLRSIAYGHNRNNAISQRTRLEPGHVTKLLDSLERLGLVERLRPITASPRTKKTAYAISDQFLRFHYRFVEPARSQLRSRTLASAYLEGTVLPQLDHHASQAWEDVCRQHVLRTVPGVTAVGRWWGPVSTGHPRRTEQRETDVVGAGDHRNPIAVGMCQWTTAEIDFDELSLLDRLAAHVEGHTGEESRYLFSRGGFSDRLREYAASDERLHLLTPADVYR